MKLKLMIRVCALLTTIIGLALSSSFISPAGAISPGEYVDLHVSADPDIWNHANAHATLYFYQSGYDHYIRGDFYFAKASIGGAMWYLQIGKEFTIIQTNFPTPEHHITVAWHPLENPIPVYGEGSRMMDDEPFLPIYSASYYFIAKRTDYSTNEVWVELQAFVTGEMGTFDVDFDWRSLSLPPRPSGGGGGGGGDGCPYVSTWAGDKYVLDNNLLPASESSGGTDVTDYYMLQQILAQREDGTYSLLLSEFENEHSFFDRAQLLAVDHPSNVNVAVSPYGEILTYTNPSPPKSATDDNNRNVKKLLGSIDENYYEGYNGSYITLNFGDEVDLSYGAKLVLRADMLKMSLHVQVQDSEGSWNTVATVIPRIRWATEIVDMSKYLRDAKGDLKVRLHFTANHKIDFVGLDITPQATIEVQEGQLVSAIHSIDDDVTTKLLHSDQTYVKLMPGQGIELAFTLLPQTMDAQNYIIIIEGHYYTLAT